jgi:hypothetical protein
VGSSSPSVPSIMGFGLFKLYHTHLVLFILSSPMYGTSGVLASSLYFFHPSSFMIASLSILLWCIDSLRFSVDCATGTCSSCRTNCALVCARVHSRSVNPLTPSMKVPPIHGPSCGESLSSHALSVPKSTRILLTKYLLRSSKVSGLGVALTMKMSIPCCPTPSGQLASCPHRWMACPVSRQRRWRFAVQ